MVKKANIIDIIRVNDKIENFTTKFGGQPDWICEPQWPMSSSWDNRPMMFLCQIVVDENLFASNTKKMAYIFITHGEKPYDDFFDPDIIFADGGENAIIIQPDGEIVPDLQIKNMVTGPTIFDDTGVSFEGYPNLEISSDPAFINENDYKKLSEYDQNIYFEKTDGNKIGGVPCFFEGDQFPDSDVDWKLLLQLNSNFLPFYLNLGASPTIFAFVSEDLKHGRLLIQGS